jgi:hypothetical protein
MSSAFSALSVLPTKIGAPRRRTAVRNRPTHVAIAITITMATAAALLGLHLGLTAPVVSPVLTSTTAELSVIDPTRTAADGR